MFLAMHAHHYPWLSKPSEPIAPRLGFGGVRQIFMQFNGYIPGYPHVDISAPIITLGQHEPHDTT